MRMSRPLVSVVIPCYNPSEFLRETMNSVLAQSYREREIVLVNDGTTEPAGLDVLASVAKRADRVIEQRNRGLPAARNAGFRVARGAYVLPLDSDDRIRPTFLAETVRALERHPGAAFAYTDYCLFGNLEKMERLAPYNLLALLDRNVIVYASLIRRTDWELAGGYDESMRLGYEDWDFWLRLAKQGRYGIHLPRVLFEYRKHGESLYSIALRHHEDLVRTIQSHHPTLYSASQRATLKKQWAPAAGIVAEQESASPPEQTIQDFWFLKNVTPKQALSACLSPAFVIQRGPGSLHPTSAELAALAVWSGKDWIRLPDGTIGVSRRALFRMRHWHEAKAMADHPCAAGVVDRRNPWQRVLGSLVRRVPAMPGGTEMSSSALVYLTPSPTKRRVAIVLPRLGPEDSELILLAIAQALDRERCEVLAIATGAGERSWRERWEQTVDHLYELSPFVEESAICGALYWMCVNWSIDALIVGHSPAGCDIAPFVRRKLPGLHVVQVTRVTDAALDSAVGAALAEAPPHTQVIISNEGWNNLRISPGQFVDLIRAELDPQTIKGGGHGGPAAPGPDRLGGVQVMKMPPDAFYEGGSHPGSDLPAINVNFGNFLRLTGLRAFQISSSVFGVTLLWRCIGPIPERIRCFAHLVGPGGEMRGSLDHRILQDNPPLVKWRPGNEGLETRLLALPARLAQGARLRLGLFDSASGTRIQIWESMLPLVDDFSAVLVEPNQPPPLASFQLAPGAPIACDVEFEGGWRMTSYSIANCGEAVWLRVCWRIPGPHPWELSFFGHGVSEALHTAPVLVSLDQRVPNAGLRTRRDVDADFVQDIVRPLGPHGAALRFLRAGLFDIEEPGKRVKIIRSTLPARSLERALYLPFPAHD